MRIRLVHAETERLNEENILPEELESPAEPSTAELLASNKRLAHIVYYSTVVSVLLMLGLVWLSSYDALVLDRRISQVQGEAVRQMDARLARLTSGAEPKPQPKYADIQIPANAPRLGDAGAPVTVVEFADFQCPFCGHFEREVYQRIVEDYVHTGKVSFVYLDFAFLGEESSLAAQAAKCATEQGAFWEYHDKLFNSQKGENQGAFAVLKLKAFAKGVVANTSLFNTCLDSEKYAQAVIDETTLGRQAGVTATPTVLVGRKLIVGALPYASFKQEIDAALANK